MVVVVLWRLSYVDSPPAMLQCIFFSPCHGVCFGSRRLWNVLVDLPESSRFPSLFLGKIDSMSRNPSLESSMHEPSDAIVTL